MMPAHFGPRPLGGSTGMYHDVTTLTLSYSTEFEALARYIPRPFRLTAPTVIVLHVMNRDIDWLAGRGYNLVEAIAPVRFEGKVDRLAGYFTLVIWENLCDPILTGRELQGMPKLFATIPDALETDGQWRGEVSHFDHTFLDFSIRQTTELTPSEIAAEEAAHEGKNHWMGWRFLPPIGGLGPGLDQPTLFPIARSTTAAWRGEGALAWRRVTWEQNPTQSHIINALAELPVHAFHPGASRAARPIFTCPATCHANCGNPRRAKRTVVPMPIEEIQRVCFVGGGTMGVFNSLLSASAGYEARVFDPAPEARRQFPERQRRIGEMIVARRVLDSVAIGKAAARVRLCETLDEAIDQADLLSESTPENLELKRETLRQADQACPPRTILTTNTSNLLVSEIDDAVGRGDRFAALHSYLGSRLFDIVAGPARRRPRSTP